MIGVKKNVIQLSLSKSLLYPPPKTPQRGTPLEKKFSVTISSLDLIPSSDIFNLPNRSLK